MLVISPRHDIASVVRHNEANRLHNRKSLAGVAPGDLLVQTSQQLTIEP